ncbi:RNA polymerase sigma-70 factor [Bacteroidota bacterium]
MDKKENHIIKGLQSGKESAFKQLFEIYYPKLVVFANKYVGNMEASRDVVQDFYLYLYESRQSIDINTSLKSYLYSSVKNRCLNQLRHDKIASKHRDQVLDSSNGYAADLDEMMDAVELQEKIFRIVSDLPAQCRRIYTMSRVEGKLNAEIADELDLSVRTIETQISLALKVLRNKLFERGQ